MQLYELLFKHYSPKDSEEGLLGYLLAESDEQVYQFIRSEPTLKNSKSIYVNWMDKDSPNEDEYDEEFKERIINCCGEMYDDEAEIADLFYGLTHYGWNCINDNISDNQIKELENIGIKVEEFKIRIEE